METTDILAQVIDETRKERDDYKELYEAQIGINFKVCKQLNEAKEDVRRLSLGNDHKICLTCPECQLEKSQEQLNEYMRLKKEFEITKVALQDMSEQLINSEDRHSTDAERIEFLETTNKRLMAEVEPMRRGKLAYEYMGHARR